MWLAKEDGDDEREGDDRAKGGDDDKLGRFLDATAIFFCEEAERGGRGEGLDKRADDDNFIREANEVKETVSDEGGEEELNKRDDE